MTGKKHPKGAKITFDSCIHWSMTCLTMCPVDSRCQFADDTEIYGPVRTEDEPKATYIQDDLDKITAVVREMVAQI